MTRQSVTVQTSDHGPVTVQCPPWCTGIHHPDGIERAAIAHTGPSIDILANTTRGPRLLLELTMWRDEFPPAADPHTGRAYILARLLDGDHFPYDAAGLEGLATDLLEAACRVQYAARRLAAENRGGDR